MGGPAGYFTDHPGIAPDVTALVDETEDPVDDADADADSPDPGMSLVFDLSRAEE